MAITPLVITGTGTADRLFAPYQMFRQNYFRVINGNGGADLLYGGYGTVSLTGGSGGDTFIIGATPGGTGTTEYTYITDYNATEGDKISLAGGLTTADVFIRKVTTQDITNLSYTTGPYRTAATVNDTCIIDKATGQYLAILKNTQAESVSIASLASLNLTASETTSLAPPTGGRVPAINLNPFAAAFGPRIVEVADYSSVPAYYLSSAIYTTLAGSADTLNKFVSFDFTDPSAPYGDYLNGRVGPLQHTHSNELELFFVVSGNYIFTEGPQASVSSAELMDVEVGAGTLCYGPLGRVHGFRAKLDDGPSRIFSLAIPAGLDKFFENAGKTVTNRFNQIKPNSLQEAINTAFWAGQRNDQLFLTPWDMGNIAPPQPGAPQPWSQLRPTYSGPSIDGRPIPTFSATTPRMVTSSVASANRPAQISKFGEQRVALVTPEEAGALTGRVAWKGPFSLPFQAGASFQYDYLSFDPATNTSFAATETIAASNPDPRDPTPSSFVVLYSLSGDLSIKLFDQINPNNPQQKIDLTFQLDPLTYVQLPTGTKYALANSGSGKAEALSILIFNQSNPPTTVASVSSQNTLPAPEVMLLTGDPAFGALDFKLTAAPSAAFLNGRNIQIGVFSVDQQNRILCDCAEDGMGTHTISPGDPNYLKEALANSKVIMSVINRRAGQPIGTSSTLTNFKSNRQIFLVAEGITIADALASLEAATSPQAIQAVKDKIRIGDGNVIGGVSAATISQSGGNVNINFGFGSAKNLTIQATPRPTSDLSNPLKLGPFNWNYSQQNLGLLDLTYDLDSRSLSNTNLDVVVNSFSRNVSSSRQRIGFYQIVDEKGTVRDPVTGNLIQATRQNAAAYFAAVNALASIPADGFAVDGTRALNYKTRLEGGYLYAPFFTYSVGKNTQTFVPFTAVNSDGLLHNVTTSTNGWSWEDGLAGNGNRRFDDLSFSLNITSPFAARNAQPPV